MSCAVLHVEALRIHAVLADLLLQIDHGRIERAGHMQPCLDAWRHEAEQLLVNAATLFEGLLRVGYGADAAGHDSLIDAGEEA
jgi:hypothetical protein